jgi:alpha-glucoside transport system permease protein
MLRSLRNTLFWIFIVPAAAVAIGLGFAVLADKLRRTESIAKSMIFLPMAISFVGAGIVWRFVYSFRIEGSGEQIGILNAIKVGLGGAPVDWLGIVPWNNLFLMIIMIWLQTGFAMVLLSSAIKGVPTDEGDGMDARAVGPGRQGADRLREEADRSWIRAAPA